MKTATMFPGCALLMALSLPAAALHAQTAPAPAQKLNPPMKMQAAPGPSMGCRA